MGGSDDHSGEDAPPGPRASAYGATRGGLHPDERRVHLTLCSARIVPSAEPSAALRPAISVVVCAYNARERIDIALRSLAAQDLDEPWEVVVAASGTDGTAQRST